MNRVTFRDLVSVQELAAHPEFLLDSRLDTETPCPECGAPLCIDLDVEKFDPTRPHERRHVTVAGCTGCEFLIEIR